jgi:hypothetical protein
MNCVNCKEWGINIDGKNTAGEVGNMSICEGEKEAIVQVMLDRWWWL